MPSEKHLIDPRVKKVIFFVGMVLVLFSFALMGLNIFGVYHQAYVDATSGVYYESVSDGYIKIFIFGFILIFAENLIKKSKKFFAKFK